jgi:hypothetical protein
MKLELSVETTYLPEWGVWEGLRELIQNGKDAETEFKAPLSVTRYKDTLRIENDGVTLPHEALLIGHTTKAERSDLIGHWGEGLDFGVLALVRAGRTVRIRSGDEVWIPSIQRSEKFNADVLVFDIQKRVKQDRVRVEVSGVTKEEWENILDRFLFLQELEPDEVIDGGYSGQLLTSERFKGRMYVKGIYVATDPELNYGYNYNDAKTDRDRKMVDSFDSKWANARIWKEAAARRPDLFDKFFVLVDEGEKDVCGLDDFVTIGSDVTDKVAAKFVERHGEDAIPVSTIGDSKELEHLGKKGVVASKAMQSIISKKVGSVETVKYKLRKEVTKRYSWHDLTEDERSNLESAIALVSPVDKVSLDEFDVVDFRSEDLQGQYKDGRQLISKKVLEDRDETLTVVVHEVAHRGGLGDGEFSHVRAIERIWSGIVAALRGENQ